MKREVQLSITGLHTGVEQNDSQQMSRKAEYFKKNDSHYILYEEQEENGEVQKCRIKLVPGRMELVRKGSLATHMVFEEHKKHMTSYGTPFGNLLLGINTHSLEFQEEEKEIRAKIAYALEMNGEPVSDCRIELRIQEMK